MSTLSKSSQALAATTCAFFAAYRTAEETDRLVIGAAKPCYDPQIPFNTYGMGLRDKCPVSASCPYTQMQLECS